ncbi:MAG: hypothetical protein A3F72_00130 [Bacteroidetes bacterium RIFCSPLOWO2_12_FULL_35_15]|nr:MAG: hypothetical protein A3F72_00130 [Bacteroidetes bacterium RIFCSPLOWO2_12_FULL_35_15]
MKKITLKKAVQNLILFLASILFVLNYTACSKPMNACFTYSPITTLTTSTDIVFNVSCSENASSYRWTFGDGTIDTTTTSLTISHKYNTAGTYTVTLNVERKDGVSIKKGKPTQEQTITVQ